MTSIDQPPLEQGVPENIMGTPFTIPEGSMDVLSSLPAPLSSPTRNVNYAQLRASAEALLLLNNPATPSILSADKENVNPVVTAPIVPISAPRPLSYAVRGKTAFRSILSVGEEDNVDELNPATNEDLQSRRFQAFQQSHNLPAFVQGTLLHDPQLPSLEKKEKASAKPPLIIRPITPSTLLALTEPCLMAWCQRIDEEDQLQIPIAADVESLHAIANLKNMMASRMSSVQNPWGY